MTRKQRRLTMIGGSLAVLAVAAALVLNAMRDSIVFFSTPAMVAEKHIPAGKRFRLGGLVQPGSLVRGDNLAVSFEVADGSATLAGGLQGNSAGSVPRRAGRGRRRRARCVRRVQGRHRARQARRDLHAQGRRRRAEEAGALEGRLRREGRATSRGARAPQRAAQQAQAVEVRSDRGSRTLRAGAGAGAGADPVDRADPRRALARSRPDECRALDRAGAIAVRRRRRSRRWSRCTSPRIFPSSTCSRIRIR